MNDARSFLLASRRLTFTATGLLLLQLSGNLYEQVVTNVGVLADPSSRVIHGEVAAGSPLFFYVPWVPAGILLAVLLARRARRSAPSWITDRLRLALAALGVAAIAKAVLVVAVNPTFRDATASDATVRESAIVWAVGNGVAIVAVAAALWWLLSWRWRVVQEALGWRR